MKRYLAMIIRDWDKSFKVPTTSSIMGNEEKYELLRLSGVVDSVGFIEVFDTYEKAKENYPNAEIIETEIVEGNREEK